MILFCFYYEEENYVDIVPFSLSLVLETPILLLIESTNLSLFNNADNNFYVRLSSYENIIFDEKKALCILIVTS